MPNDPTSHGTVVTVVDVETTGIDHTTEHITEIAAVKILPDGRTEEWSTFVNPGKPISSFISELTGIFDHDVRDAPRVEEVLPVFLEFAHGTVLAAHNAAFDLSFLRTAASKAGIEWPSVPVIDTLTLARLTLTKPHVANYRLETISTSLQCAATPHHRALADAQTAAEVLTKLLSLYPIRPVTGWHDPQECLSTAR